MTFKRISVRGYKTHLPDPIFSEDIEPDIGEDGRIHEWSRLRIGQSLQAAGLSGVDFVVFVLSPEAARAFRQGGATR